MENLILAYMLGVLLTVLLVGLIRFSKLWSNASPGKANELNTCRDMLQANALLYSHNCRRISRQLHDGVSQDLSLMKLNLHLYKNNQQQEHLEQMQELVDRSIIELRSISRKMQPEDVNCAGIRNAIDMQVQFLERNFSISCSIDDPEALLNDSRQDNLILYSLLEELLMNAAQHANANSIQLIAENLNGRQSFTVKDNGKGFEPDKIVWGQGFTYIMEQVQHLGASIKLDAALGKGTCIVMVL